MRLPTTDSATIKALRTIAQTVFGLFIAVWAVPGVPEVVKTYLINNLPTVFLAVGIPAGIITIVWHVLKQEKLY